MTMVNRLIFYKLMLFGVRGVQYLPPRENERGQCAVYYAGPQSFIITFFLFVNNSGDSSEF